MNKILVHATGAKTGGGLTILNSYCEAKTQDDLNYYYIFSPIKPPLMPKNSEWIEARTNGVSTLFFSLIMSVFYYFHLKCNSLVSFSNVNSIFGLGNGNRITYFHNMLICISPSVKYKIIRFILRYINQSKVEYIFQTKFVADEFSKAMGYIPIYKVCWPGVPATLNVSTTDDSIPFEGPFLLVPITNLSNKHKNFDLIVKLASLLEPTSNLKFLVTTLNTVGYADLPSNIVFVKSLSHDNFLKLLSVSDGVVVTSTIETVCLPIFEALSMGKHAYVFKAEYLHGLHELLDGVEHISIFNDAIEFLNSVHKSTKIDFNKSNFNKSNEFISGNWEF
ncbi:hypothetical protein [Vibrio sp. DNB22_19_1]